MDYDIKDFKFNVDLKSVDEKGFFEGYASTFDGPPDLGGDVVKPGAFVKTIEERGIFGNGIKMLWQHDMHDPAGIWHELREDKVGLRVRGQLAVESDTGRNAYALMKIGALDGMSIGYNAKDFEIIEDENGRTRYIKEAALYEISLVTFGMNTRAKITDVKSAVENSKNERELEHALRDAGLSKHAAEYITSLVKHSLVGYKENKLTKILQELKNTNVGMVVHRLLMDGQEGRKE